MRIISSVLYMTTMMMMKTTLAATTNILLSGTSRMICMAHVVRFQTSSFRHGATTTSTTIARTAPFPFGRSMHSKSTTTKFSGGSPQRTRSLPFAIHNDNDSTMEHDSVMLSLDDENSNDNDKKKNKKSNKKNKESNILSPSFRADRVLNTRGWGESRSECSALLKSKRVSLVQDDGTLRILQGPSEKIPLHAHLLVDGIKVVPDIPLLLVYHKPKWVLSVMNDPQGRANLGTILQQEESASVYARQKDLHPVGRLDYDTSGLILFSTNGQLTQRLLHPTHGVEKEYTAIVGGGDVDPDRLSFQLTEGVTTAEGIHVAQLVPSSAAAADGSSQLTTRLAPDVASNLLADIRRHLPKEYNVTDLEERGYLMPPSDGEIEMSQVVLTEVRLIVAEGKHRMVRRMLANCGHPVVSLKRVRQGIVCLGDLPEGAFRTLTLDEQRWAESLLITKNK